MLIAIVLFTTNKLRMDVVALLVIIAFVLSGTLSLQEATDPNVLLIAALFVIGEGLVRADVAYQVGDWLVKVAGNSERKMLSLLMVTVNGLGAFMSSTSVVVIFIPMLLSVAARMKTEPGRRLAIRSGSSLLGRSLDELHLRTRYGANVVGIERWKRFRRVMVSASGSTELHERDVLLIDMSDNEVDLREFCHEQQLEPMVLRGDYFAEQVRNVGMAEVSLVPDSALLGKSLREAAFRSRYDLYFFHFFLFNI